MRTQNTNGHGDSAVRLTELETKALRELFDSADGNGHDFGVIEDLIDAKIMGREQVSGVVSSLVQKGIILHHGEENGCWGTAYTQFTWGKVFGSEQIYPDSFDDLVRLGNLIPALMSFEGLRQNA